VKFNPRDARTISIGIEFVVSVMLGLGAGYWLDKKLGTAPWLMLVGIGFGSAAGFRALLQAMKSSTAQAERTDAEEARRPHGHENAPVKSEPPSPPDRNP
jgi:ATP synthase protein I